MLHIFIVMLLLGISHSVCFYVMTKPKYSAYQTALIYAGYTVLFVGLSMLSSAFLKDKTYAVGIGFAITITVALFVFMLTSADERCKKIFLFLSYANVFCICVCVSFVLCNMFKNASEAYLYCVRNITRTVLLILIAFVYVRFLRSYVKVVSGKQRKIFYSISTVSILFFAVAVLVYGGDFMDDFRYNKIYDSRKQYCVCLLKHGVFTRIAENRKEK